MREWDGLPVRSEQMKRPNRLGAAKEKQRPPWLSKILCDSLSTLQRKRHVHPAGRRFGVFAAAGSDHNVLFAINFVRDRRRIAGERKRSFPQQVACRLVEHTKLLVIIGSTDKDQPARGNDRPTIVFTSRVLHSLIGEFRIFANRNFPLEVTGIQVNRVQRAPWRSNRRISLRFEKPGVSVKTVPHLRLHRPARYLFILSLAHK